MNSRYLRRQPQLAQTPQLQWPTMTMPPPPQIDDRPSSMQQMIGSLGNLGVAGVNKLGAKEDDYDDENQTVDSVNPMQKRKQSILDMLTGGEGFA